MLPMRRTIPVLLAASVAAVTALVPARSVLASTPSLTQVHDISVQATVACVDGREFTQFFSTPAAGDLFGDGRKEIVAALPDGSVHVWYTNTWQEAAGWPRNVGDDVASSPTLAVLDGDSHPSIIVSSYVGSVNVFDRFGNERPGWPQFTRTTAHNGPVEPGFFASVAVGDAFNDGRKELFTTGLDQYTYAWFSNGSALSSWPILTSDSGLATPALADLRHNGTLSVVTPSDASGRDGVTGGLYFAYANDGTRLWEQGVNEVPWASPAIADTGGGNLVVFNGTGHFYNQTRNPAVGKFIPGFNQDGSAHGGFPAGTNGVLFASPAVGDLAGDGGREVVDVTESGELYAVHTDGSAYGGFPRAVPGWYGFSAGPAIAPVDAGGRNGIYQPSGNTLVVYAMDNVGSPTIVQTPGPPAGQAATFSTPTVADLGGGHLSVVLGSVQGSQACGSSNTYDITVWSVNGTNPSAMGASSWPTFHGNMQRSGSNLPPPAPPPPSAHGYWLVASDGGLFPFGNAQQHSYGSTGGMHLNSPIVAMAGTADDSGYYLAASDGGLFPFGTATQHSYGSTGNIHLNSPIVAMALTRTGNGYYLVASDGGIFPFGDAQQHSYGSTGGIHLNQPIVGMALTSTGNGYWLVASDGGIFPFGDAQQHSYGSTGGMHLNQPIVGMQPTMSGNGYWLVASDGGLFPFGDAQQHSYGSTGGIHLNQPIVGMARSFDGNGYYLVASDGGIFPFGDARGYGSTGGMHLNQPIVNMAATRVTTPGV